MHFYWLSKIMVMSLEQIIPNIEKLTENFRYFYEDLSMVIYERSKQMPVKSKGLRRKQIGEVFGEISRRHNIKCTSFLDLKSLWRLSRAILFFNNNALYKIKHALSS